MGSTIKQVAKAAGVSTCTVSRILNETDGFTFRADTCKRIRTLARQMGYAAAPSSRAVRTGKTFSVAFVSQHPMPARSYYDAEIHAALSDALMSKGYDLTAYSPLRCREFMPVFEKKHDGVILSWTTDPRLGLSLRQTGLPLVEMNARSGAKGDCVEPGDTEAGQMLGEYLIKVGYRNIVFLGEAKLRAYARERLDGIRQAVRHTGVDVEVVNIASVREIVRYVKSLSADKRSRTVLVQDGGVQTLQAIYYMAVGMGLEVPRDFGLASCDISTTPHGIEEKSISGTTYSIEEMVHQAADMLLAKITNPADTIPPCVIHHHLYEGDTLRREMQAGSAEYVADLSKAP